MAVLLALDRVGRAHHGADDQRGRAVELRCRRARHLVAASAPSGLGARRGRRPPASGASSARGPTTRKRQGLVRWWFGAQRASSSSSVERRRGRPARGSKALIVRRERIACSTSIAGEVSEGVTDPAGRVIQGRPMQQLTLVEPGRVEWTDAPEPALEGARPGARPPARGGALRSRRQHRQRRVPDADAGRARPRVRGRGGGGRGRRSGRARRATAWWSRSRSRAANARAAGAARPATARACRGSRCTASAPSAATGAARSSDLVRVPYADAMLVPLPDGLEPATVASASDNIPDAWRTVAPPLERRPGAEVLVVAGGARSIALYAAGHGAGPRRGQGGLRRR